MKKVKVHLPQSVALKKGLAKWGAVEVELQPILDLLTADEREALHVFESHYKGEASRHGSLEIRAVQGGYDVLTVAETSCDGVVAAIRAQRAKYQAERESKIKKLDEILADPSLCVRADGDRKFGFQVSDLEIKCKDLQIDPAPYLEVLDAESKHRRTAWLHCWRQFFDNWTPGVELTEDLPYFSADVCVVDNKLDVGHAVKVAKAVEFDDVLFRIEQYLASVRAQREQVELEKKEEQERAKQAWLDWAKEHGSQELRESIADGYPLGREIERQVETAVFPATKDQYAVYSKVADSKDRQVPKQQARQLETYLKAQITATRRNLPAGAALAVGRISQVEIWITCDCDQYYPCGGCDHDHERLVKRTAVPVHLRSAHYDADRWYVIRD